MAFDPPTDGCVALHPNKRGRNADPPTSSSDIMRVSSAARPDAPDAPTVGSSLERIHREEPEDEYISLASASLASSAAVHYPPRHHDDTILPPSALRSGRHSVGSGVGSVRSASSRGINRENSAPAPTTPSIRNHIEPRNRRLSSTGRISSVARGDSDSSVVAFVGRMGRSATDSALAMMPPVHKRSRFAASVAALAGLIGVLGVMLHPAMRTPLAPKTTTSRVLLKETSSWEPPKVDASAHAEEMTALATTSFFDDFDQRRRRAADLPDGTVFSEPAHTRMCRAIIERLDAYDAGVTTFDQVVFTESEYVCRDPDAPYTAVLNMFAAQLLHVANNDIGLKVDYTHRCAKWERFCTGNMTTIQFHLPDPLSINAYAFQPGCVDAPNLRQLCTDSLASADPTSPDNILFPNGYLDTATNACDLGCHFSQVLPWIRNNLRTVATEWLNTVETRALTFWLRNAAEFSHREKDDMEVSVVGLSCANDDCDMSMSSCVCQFDPLPNWVYAMHIPRSSTNIAIVASPTCAKFGEGCVLHAQELFYFFHKLYPRADITYNVITSTSSWYMRMITADHLVCPPGVGCLLPAIARDAYTYVYEKTAPTVSTWLTCVPTDYLNRMILPSFPPLFIESDCRHLRARIGAWEPDMALAADLQYSTPVDGYLGCADTNYVPTAEDPFRAPTTYRWDETVWATCPVAVMNEDTLCTEMDRLGLTRILFVGDHTTMTQAISLASVLGQNDAISLDPNVVPNFTKTFTCPSGSSFDLTYIRNDRLEEPGTTPSPGFPNCGPANEQYCYPWSSDYAAYPTKQLLIINTGYHWGDNWEGYIANFQNFVGKIDEVATTYVVRVNDVIMFRTSIPGHKECHLHDGVYHHYGEYCPRIVNGAFWHWWGELPPYNDYAIRIINEWNLLNTVKNGPDIELLDPWMMTILRPDGHLSGSDAGPNCSIEPQECMLYSLPGPVDWWNHLLVMQLKDIGTHLENDNPMQAWR